MLFGLGEGDTLPIVPLTARDLVASFKADENAIGPTLFKLANRPVGSVEGFRYSGPMKRSEFKWDAAHLEQFLSNPQAIVPGNRMPYSGLEDKAQLKILVNYLLTMGQ